MNTDRRVISAPGAAIKVTVINLTPEQRKALTVAYTNELREEAQAITDERIEHDRRVSRTWLGRLWVRLRDSVAV